RESTGSSTSAPTATALHSASCTAPPTVSCRGSRAATSIGARERAGEVLFTLDSRPARENDGPHRRKYMDPGPKKNCPVDDERLGPLRACMEPSGPDEPPADWPEHSHSCISERAVAYSCGRLAIEGHRVKHLHDREELRLVRWIAKRAAHYLDGVEVKYSEGSSPYLPFYLTTNIGDNLADDASPDAIRHAFGAVIYPA